ncbi:MAG: type I pantothenate kinase [Acidimicrobiia bacterium]
MSSPFYLDFDEESWSALRASTPLTLSEEDVESIRGITVNLDMAMVEATYLPLSRLLNLHVQANSHLGAVTETFLGAPPAPTPFIIGVAGSVAVGKSTISRVMQALLARWPQHPAVELVTTDGFLLPNAELEARGLMDRKGFPESYDRKALLEFVARSAAGEDELEIPIYSHIAYDIVADEVRVMRRPDILIVEGLNVLQAGESGAFVSDYFDFSIFVDADPGDIETWYLKRFLSLRDTAFTQPDAYFRKYAGLSDEQAIEVASEIWREVNLRNLVENILPTRDRASLILEKASDHSVTRVRLRR